ncbi:MAG: hypothetical protein C0518_11355 [Opitutus sp.]|nr:hypothetical protein [Opitutus sp.]
MKAIVRRFQATSLLALCNVALLCGCAQRPAVSSRQAPTSGVGFESEAQRERDAARKADRLGQKPQPITHQRH